MNASYIWLIPFLPLLSSVVIRLFGRRVFSRSLVHGLACGSVFTSFALAVCAFLQLTQVEGEGKALVNTLYPWIRVGTFEVWARFLFDPLSAVFTLVITGVGSLIHLYSTGYMAHEKDFERYFSYLNLFMAMMLVLVLGDSLLLMFVGWEGVGLCSFLLIGFWFGEKANADAAKKAFVVNRIGDFGFIVGMLILFWVQGMNKGVWSLDYAALRESTDLFTTIPIFGVTAITLATLLLFVGASGKSAQIPLYVWLPDAMAGPTPVSALIHAATMVTAGIYMIARLSFLFDLAPVTLHVIAIVGAFTAIFAATIGLVQNDIKKVLAYSTVSQLGYMFLACGVGSYAAGVFHVMTHAFFKALLFLGAGSVIHAMSGEQDMRNMGGLKDKIPWTFRTFFVATLAIAGIFPFAGFFSKDEILWQAFSSPHGSPILWFVGLCAAAMTSFYMFRLVYMTFYGECRASHDVQHHIHESPMNMLLPLMILAVLSIVGGMIWWPGFLPLSHTFPHWLESAVVVHEHEGASHALEAGLAGLSLTIAISGWFFARHFYLLHPDRPKQLALNWPRAHKLLYNKYYIDEIYGVLFVGGVKKLSAFLYAFDKYVVDGIVNGTGTVLKVFVFIYGLFDRLFVDGLVNLVGATTMSLGRKARSFQNGQIQAYLGAMAGVLVTASMIWVFYRF